MCQTHALPNVISFGLESKNNDTECFNLQRKKKRICKWNLAAVFNLHSYSKSQADDATTDILSGENGKEKEKKIYFLQSDLEDIGFSKDILNTLQSKNIWINEYVYVFSH